MVPPGTSRCSYDRAAYFCAALVGVFSILALFGWVSGIAGLARLGLAYIPMAPSTAFCFALAGAALALATAGRARAFSRALPAIICLIAAAKLIELATAAPWDPDVLFLASPHAFGRVLTARMSPVTAITFMLVAAGLFLLGAGRRDSFAAVGGAVACLVSSVVLIGYWYGTPLLYGGAIIPVALPTGCSFFFLGIGVISACGPSSWPLREFIGRGTAAVLLRSFLPVVIAATLLNGWTGVSLLGRAHLNPAVASALSALAFAALGAVVISRIAARIGNRIDEAEGDARRARGELEVANRGLEERVAQRTLELRTKNSQMEEELEMARELQFAMLPRHFPSVPRSATFDESALRFLSVYFPTGQVSGDFFTVVPLADRKIGVLICDVMGHGVRAALVASMVRALVEQEADRASEPGEVLSRINSALAAILKQSGATMFVTGFYLIADLDRLEWRYASAGHPRPLRISAAAARAEPLALPEGAGPAMGLFPSAQYSVSTLPLAAGDLVMLFTDGLFEIEDQAGKLFTEGDLLSTVRSHLALEPQEFFAHVLRDIRATSGSENFADDVCVVGIQVRHTCSKSAPPSGPTPK